MKLFGILGLQNLQLFVTSIYSIQNQFPPSSETPFFNSNQCLTTVFFPQYIHYSFEARGNCAIGSNAAPPFLTISILSKSVELILIMYITTIILELNIHKDKNILSTMSIKRLSRCNHSFWRPNILNGTHTLVWEFILPRLSNTTAWDCHYCGFFEFLKMEIRRYPWSQHFSFFFPALPIESLIASISALI